MFRCAARDPARLRELPTPELVRPPAVFDSALDGETCDHSQRSVSRNFALSPGQVQRSVSHNFALHLVPSQRSVNHGFALLLVPSQRSVSHNFALSLGHVHRSMSHNFALHVVPKCPCRQWSRTPPKHQDRRVARKPAAAMPDLARLPRHSFGLFRCAGSVLGFGALSKFPHTSDGEDLGRGIANSTPPTLLDFWPACFFLHFGAQKCGESRGPQMAGNAISTLSAVRSVAQLGVLSAGRKKTGI